MSAKVTCFTRSGRHFIGFENELGKKSLLPKRAKRFRWICKWTIDNCPSFENGDPDDALQIIVPAGHIMNKAPEEVAVWFARTHTSIQAFLLKVNSGAVISDPHFSAIKRLLP